MQVTHCRKNQLHFMTLSSMKTTFLFKQVGYYCFCTGICYYFMFFLVPVALIGFCTGIFCRFFPMFFSSCSATDLFFYWYFLQFSMFLSSCSSSDRFLLYFLSFLSSCSSTDLFLYWYFLPFFSPCF